MGKSFRQLKKASRCRVQIGFGLISILAIMCSLTCKLRNPISLLKISDEVRLDTVERRFIFDELFKPAKQVNLICFRYTDPLTVVHVDKPPLFSDGNPLIIRAYLKDQHDNLTVLDNISRNSPNYQCLSPDDYSSWLTISDSEVQFASLSVRSNRPIVVSRIEWESHDATDMK